jgi:hypothetical protein
MNLPPIGAAIHCAMVTAERKFSDNESAADRRRDSLRDGYR